MELGMRLTMLSENPMFAPVLEQIGIITDKDKRIISSNAIMSMPLVKAVVTLHDSEGKRISVPVSYELLPGLKMDFESRSGLSVVETNWRTRNQYGRNC